MQDINDIFLDSNKRDLQSYLCEHDDGLKMTFAQKGSVCDCISSLSEIFTEWYLFDSSHEKDIQKFLDEENLNDIFSESEFMDIMCGNAYVDSNMLQFIKLKLPFRVTSNKLHILNTSVLKNNVLAYPIKNKDGLIDKLYEQIEINRQLKKEKDQERKTKNKERKKIVKHAYYLRNKEYIQKLKQAYYSKNKEYIKKRSKEYYANNKDRIKEYYAMHKEHRQKIKHDNYIKNKEYYSQRSKAYYESHKEKQKQYLKEYYIAHKEKQKQYIKIYYAKSKQNKAIAQTICAAYILLSKLKKENKKQYLELYRKQQDPLRHMLKTCIALQNKDINMCPLCNKKCGNSLEQNCNQKVLSLPGATDKIQNIANNLKQR